MMSHIFFMIASNLLRFFKLTELIDNSFTTEETGIVEEAPETKIVMVNKIRILYDKTVDLTEQYNCCYCFPVLVHPIGI